MVAVDSRRTLMALKTKMVALIPITIVTALMTVMTNAHSKQKTKIVLKTKTVVLSPIMIRTVYSTPRISVPQSPVLTTDVLQQRKQPKNSLKLRA